jgi:hypothetical protein
MQNDLSALPSRAVGVCTGNDDNFLGKKDGIFACLRNSGGTCATPFGSLKDALGSFLGVKTNDPYAVEGSVLIQGEVDVVPNHIWPFHHTRNVNLKPPFLELLERHSIRTLQDTENFKSHCAYSAVLDQQMGNYFGENRSKTN